MFQWLKSMFRRRAKCPKCEKRTVEDLHFANGELLERCLRPACGWERLTHGTPIHDELPKECPRCGDIITRVDGVWSCSMCEWHGLHSEWRKTWA